MKFLKKFNKKEEKTFNHSRDAAKERLHLVLMQDRANVSADFLELMKQEIIEVIKKYIEIDETSIDVKLTNKENEDGTNGAPALYANIPIINIKNDSKKEPVQEESINKENKKDKKEKVEEEDKKEEVKSEDTNKNDSKENKEEKAESVVEDDKKKDKLEVATENKPKETKEELKSEN